jgi:KaiC/GvpD/RAD55 family RecA-like ATPase
MPEPDIVKTGIAGLDEILTGGIPRGNVILVEGAIGCGKTTMGVEFIYRGAKEFGEPGLIVLFEVSPEKITRDASNFGWDLQELEKQKKLKIVFTTRDVLRQELQQADSVLLEQAASIGARRIFIDGVGRLLGMAHRTRARPFTCSRRGSNARTSRPFWRSKLRQSCMGITAITATPRLRYPRNPSPIR